MDGIPFSSVCQSSIPSHRKVQLPKGWEGDCAFAPAACHTIGLTLGLGIPWEFFNSLDWVFSNQLIHVWQSGVSEVVTFCIKLAYKVI